MHTVKPCYSLQVLFLAASYLEKIARFRYRSLYCIRNSRMIRLDMAMKRKIGLENLQKFDYDQITIVTTHKKAPMIMIIELIPIDYDCNHN